MICLMEKHYYMSHDEDGGASTAYMKATYDGAGHITYHEIRISKSDGSVVADITDTTTYRLQDGKIVFDSEDGSMYFSLLEETADGWKIWVEDTWGDYEDFWSFHKPEGYPGNL